MERQIFKTVCSSVIVRLTASDNWSFLISIHIESKMESQILKTVCTSVSKTTYTGLKLSFNDLLTCVDELR